MDTKTNHTAVAYDQVSRGIASAAVERAVEMDKLAAANGHTFEGKNTFFAWGTELIDSGKETFKSKAKLHAELPFLNEIVPSLVAQIDSEMRHEEIISMDSMTMDSEGAICANGINNISISRWALGQALTRAKAPAGSLGVISPNIGQELSSVLRSQIFDHYMYGSCEKRHKSVSLRIRTINGQEEIFAATSTKYQAVDGNKVAKMFSDMMPAGSKGAVKYDGHKWRVTGSLMSNIEPVVGEIFEVNFFCEGADDGSMPIRIGCEVVRTRCVNLTVLKSTQIDSVRHYGKLSVEAKVKALIENAAKTANDFGKVWADAMTSEVCENASEVGAERIFQVLVAKRLVHVPGVEDKDMVARLFSAWTVEPDYTKAGILNAVTRAAHSNPWSNPWAVETLGETAGELLYNKLYFSERDFSDLDVG